MFLASRATAGAARRRLAGLCCLPLLAITGCSGGEEEPQPIIRSDTASESPESPSAQPSKKPWEKRTKAGAVAFVKHWVDVFNEAGATGDTSELREISAAGCKSCLGYAGMIDNLYESGGHLRSDGWTVREAGVAPGVSLNKMLVGTRIERSIETIIRNSGERDRYPGGSASYSAFPRWRDGWVMSRFVNSS